VTQITARVQRPDLWVRLRRKCGEREAELRSYSTRARITPTSFVNDYSWGDFKGNADEDGQE